MAKIKMKKKPEWAGAPSKTAAEIAAFKRARSTVVPLTWPKLATSMKMKMKAKNQNATSAASSTKLAVAAMKKSASQKLESTQKPAVKKTMMKAMSSVAKTGASMTRRSNLKQQKGPPPQSGPGEQPKVRNTKQPSGVKQDKTPETPGQVQQNRGKAVVYEVSSAHELRECFQNDPERLADLGLDKTEQEQRAWADSLQIIWNDNADHHDFSTVEGQNLYYLHWHFRHLAHTGTIPNNCLVSKDGKRRTNKGKPKAATLASSSSSSSSSNSKAMQTTTTTKRSDKSQAELPAESPSALSSSSVVVKQQAMKKSMKNMTMKMQRKTSAGAASMRQKYQDKTKSKSLQKNNTTVTKSSTKKAMKMKTRDLKHHLNKSRDIPSEIPMKGFKESISSLMMLIGLHEYTIGDDALVALRSAVEDFIIRISHHNELLTDLVKKNGANTWYMQVARFIAENRLVPTTLQDSYAELGLEDPEDPLDPRFDRAKEKKKQKDAKMKMKQTMKAKPKSKPGASSNNSKGSKSISMRMESSSHMETKMKSRKEPEAAEASPPSPEPSEFDPMKIVDEAQEEEEEEEEVEEEEVEEEEEEMNLGRGPIGEGEAKSVPDLPSSGVGSPSPFLF
ncbi:unnamed protein product [Amoebophrya sp. A25]|nr:unnamed protein product [Amoebophrya sp. A25]|eukprot:GSA25T00027183001.1